MSTYIIRIKLTLSNFVRIVNGGMSRFKSMLSIVKGSVGFRFKLGIPVLMYGLRSSIASLRQSFTLSFRTASLQYHKDPIVICWGKYMHNSYYQSIWVFWNIPRICDCSLTIPWAFFFDTIQQLLCKCFPLICSHRNWGCVTRNNQPKKTKYGDHNVGLVKLLLV